MKRVSNLLAVAPLALALLIAVAQAGGHSGYNSSRVGMSDAAKAADQDEDGARWLEDDNWSTDFEPYRELRSVAWPSRGGTLTVDGGENGGAYVTGWGRDSVRVVARVFGQARTEERARELAKAVRIVRKGDRLTAEGPEPGRHESWSVTFDVLAPRSMA